MNKPEKTTFGQHLEYGLTHLGDKLCEIYNKHQEHEAETISLGLFSDKEKLELLKAEMYRATRARGNTEYIANLRSTIEVLEALIDRKHKREYHPYNLLSSLISSLFVLSFLIGCFSFPISAICKNYHSQFCNTSRQITNTVASPFFESNK